MTEAPPPIERDDLDDVTRFIHLGLTVFGLLALITGLWAGDYKRVHHLGFTVHKWLGLTLSFFMAWRIWLGFYGPREARFSQWAPFTPERLKLADAWWAAAQASTDAAKESLLRHAGYWYRRSGAIEAAARRQEVNDRLGEMTGYPREARIGASARASEPYSSTRSNSSMARVIWR